MPTHCYLTFTNAAQGRAAAFNAWCDDIPIPDIMASLADTRALERVG